MIWDQFMEQISSPRLQEHLLMGPDSLTLHRAEEVDFQFELATQDAQTLSQSPLGSSSSRASSTPSLQYSVSTEVQITIWATEGIALIVS